MGGPAYSKLGLYDDAEDDEEIGLNGGLSKRPRAYGSRNNLAHHGSGNGVGSDQFHSEDPQTITL